MATTIKELSRYFSREEFACKCGCGYNAVDAVLLDVLMEVRRNYDAPVTITSGCRCDEHNRFVDGAEESKHLLGIAADIQVKGVDPERVADHLNHRYPGMYGIGRYCSWTHVDVREHAARWRG